ncbi:hypothetical protein HDU93_001983 [Gonapodya sp. JEL0774]|nr:hypothetical protein HDU93_001983 [Gonapodya sp. JEL0774]
MNASESESDRLVLLGVEMGSLELLRQGLGLGGSPNARKAIVLKVDLERSPNDAKRSFFEWVMNRQKKITERKTVEDISSGESALAIAVRDRRVDLVRELLVAGGDPNTQISWRIPYWHSLWTRERWDATRWLCTYFFESALDLALESGLLAHRFNKRGPIVLIKNPSEGQEISEKRTLTPSLEIVQLLLANGARPGPASFNRAKKIQDPRFLEVLSSKIGGVTHRNNSAMDTFTSAHREVPTQIIERCRNPTHEESAYLSTSHGGTGMESEYGRSSPRMENFVEQTPSDILHEQLQYLHQLLSHRNAHATNLNEIRTQIRELSSVLNARRAQRQKLEEEALGKHWTKCIFERAFLTEQPSAPTEWECAELDENTSEDLRGRFSYLT